MLACLYRTVLRLWSLAIVIFSCAPAVMAGNLTIVVGDNAAQELQKYVRTLYQFTPAISRDTAAKLTGATILIGRPSNNKLIASLASDLKWDSLLADGFFLKTSKTKPDVLVVGGASGRGTLFGVYKLVERWGVRFSLTEDILPEKPGPFRLARFDDKSAPAYPIRALRPLNNLPEGSAPWELADFKRFIDQMAKLKYNTYVFAMMESGPWLDYEFRGMRRPDGGSDL
ncbi:MAG: hypothetical protein EXQ58_00365 [Acidobacteria bacterium]|nr:hypothetical protein [Acidobacteriota bacterium]